MTYSAWQRAVDEAGLMEGPALKFANERWTSDDAPIETGKGGAQFTVLMPTCIWGWRSFELRKRELYRFEDCPPPAEDTAPGPEAEGWRPYTAVQVVGDNLGSPFDDERQLMAFTSLSAGGRLAFMDLVAGYLRKGERSFPVVILGSKLKQGPKKDYLAPTFTIVGWKARDEFADFLPPPRQPMEGPPVQLLEPPTRLADVPNAVVEDLEPGVDPADEIPF